MKNWQEMYLKIIEGYRPIDDDFLRILLRGDLPLAQKILRIITGLDDLVLTSEETQYDMKRLGGARSLCLDVLGTDSKGRIYNLEIQRADTGATEKRARYHSSSMDIEFLDSGEDFEQLPITYVIFITEHDVRKDGRLIYRIERTDTETGKIFDDGAHIIYVNSEYNGSDCSSELAKLMHDFKCVNADDMYTNLLAERTRYFKETQEGVASMCKAMEKFVKDITDDAFANGKSEGKVEGIAEGKAEGRAEGMLDTLAKLVKDGAITIEIAANNAGLSVDEFRSLAMA